MAHDVHRPHDKLFRTVFIDHAEAAALLRAHLPESIAGDLRWSTLTLQDRTFVDPDLRDTESDLLFSIRRKAGAPPAWLYVLLEHQSRPDRWIRFRLLKYCCRIWDRSRRQFPREWRLRPIVPLVFYQGPGRWRHPSEFAELFADPVRDWPWVPRFAHLLIDQSQVGPQAVSAGRSSPVAAAVPSSAVPFVVRVDELPEAARVEHEPLAPIPLRRRRDAGHGHRVLGSVIVDEGEHGVLVLPGPGIRDPASASIPESGGPVRVEPDVASHHYNFLRTHETLRVTPAMEAGIVDCFMDVKDLVRMLEEDYEERRPKTRGPYRKRP